MLDVPKVGDGEVIIFNEEGRCLSVDAGAVACCTSVEHLMEVVGRASLSHGVRCYRLLQLLPGYAHEHVRRVDAVVAQPHSAQEGRGSLAGMGACVPPSLFPTSASTHHVDGMLDNCEARNLSMSEKPPSMVRRRVAPGGGGAAGSLRPQPGQQPKAWACPPLATLPLPALKPLDQWPLHLDAATAAVASDGSLSHTLSYHSSPLSTCAGGSSASTASPTSFGSPLSPLRSGGQRRGTAEVPPSSSASLLNSPSPLKRVGGGAAGGAPSVATVPPTDLLPAGAVVLVALFTRSSLGGRAAEAISIGPEASLSSPDSRPTPLRRPLSCQSIVSPTGKQAAMDLLLQSNSSAQYGLSSGRNTGVSGNSFASLATPLTYTASTPTAVRGASHGYWSFAGSGGVVGTTGATAGAAAGAWVMPNLSDSFAPSIAAFSAAGDNANAVVGLVNNSFISAAPLSEAPHCSTRVCVAASSAEAFPARLGALQRVRCGYGDTRFSRGAAVADGEAGEGDRAGGAPNMARNGLSNTSFTNTSIIRPAVAPARDAGGALTMTGSGGGYLCSSGNNSFASPFGAVGTMQPVPSFTHPLASPNLQSQHLSHPVQHQHQHQHQRFSPLAKAAAAAAAGRVVAHHSASYSPNMQHHSLSSAAGLSASPPSAHPLPAAHPAWRNAVPPLPKATVSFAIALHIGRNKEVIRCLLRHYMSNEVELVLKALKRGHPFLRSAAAHEYILGGSELTDPEESADEADHASHRPGTSSEEGEALALGNTPLRSSSGFYTRRSGANFTSSTSFDLDPRHRRTLTPAQASRKVLLYRQYFAYVECCVAQGGAALEAVVADVARAAREVPLTSTSPVSPPTSALSSVRARLCMSGAVFGPADEDEACPPCAGKSTLAPSTPSCGSPERGSLPFPVAGARSCSDTLSYATSGIYSLGRTLRPQSSTFEDNIKRDCLLPTHAATASAAVELGCEEAYGWLKLTPQTAEVTAMLARPLSYMDRARAAQLQRLRQHLVRTAPRTAAEVRASQLHLLLRGACDDEAAAMEGLLYLVSLAKSRAGEGGSAAHTSASHAESKLPASPSPLVQRPALAKAFAAIQQRNEEVGWFTGIEKAVTERRIKPARLMEVVEQLEQDPNAVMELWYNAEEATRETLRLTSQYLTRRAHGA